MAKPEMTPAICAAAADKAIQTYINKVGAFGDADKVRKALQMLISKCALGYGYVSNQVAMMDLLLRTSVHTATAMEGGQAYKQETMQ